MNRWILAPLGCFALAGACDRADRDLTPFQPSDATVGSGSQNEVTAGGGEGGAGGAGGEGGAGGAGGGSFCDGPALFCQECATCMVTGACSATINDCDGQLECGQALDCLRICRDGCLNDPTCLSGCHDSCSQSAPGYGAALAALDCFCRDGCPIACAAETGTECLVYLP